MITAESVRDLYYEAFNEAGDWQETSGQPLVQAEMQLKGWDAVIRYIRKDSEVELERLREENRQLKQAMIGAIELDARQGVAA